MSAAAVPSTSKLPSTATPGTANPGTGGNRSIGGGVIPTNRSLSVDEAATHALERLAVLLRYPDDLASNLDSLRKKTASEKAAVDAQLKAATQSQLNDCQTGLDNLVHVRESLDSGRSMLANVHGNGVKSIGMIPSFARVQKLSVIHANFQATRRTLAHFQALNDRVDRLRATLDAHHQDLLGPAPDLLFMHHELFQLEAFRDATLAQVRNAPDDTINTVRHYFRRLDDLSERFNEYLWDLARHLLDLVHANRPNVVVRLAKILEFEEKADEAELAAREAEQQQQQQQQQQLQQQQGGLQPPSNPAGMSHSASMASVGTNGVTGPGRQRRRHREIKNYRSQFFDVVHESISIKFIKVFDPDREVPEMLGTTHDMVLADLTFVYDELVDLFPKKYKLFPFFVLEYHRHVYDLINKIILEKMETGTILFILRWCREYYTDMNDKLGVAEELLEPRLLDGQERVLVDDYLKLIRSKLDEWLKNLLNSETKDFIERDHPPESDSQGMYGLSASVILFNMVNQQIDIVLDSSRGQLLLDVVKECTRVLGGYQTHFANLVSAESAKFFSDPDKCKPGLLDYTMALANDSLKCTEFVELIIQRLENEADYTFRAPIAKELNAVMDGFMRVAKAATTVLMDMAFADLKVAFGVLFSPVWYKGEDVMSNVAATLNDYCNDFREHLQDYLFGKLMTDVMDRFAVSWIEAMRGKQAKFLISNPQTGELLAHDHRQVVDMFAQFKSLKRVEKVFDVIDRLFRVLCASRKMIFLDFYSLAKAYPDVPLSVVEELLAKRDDLDKGALKETIEGIRAKHKQTLLAQQQASEGGAEGGGGGSALGEKSVFSIMFPNGPPPSK
ncbi:exocyst complex component Sec6-domain-containing protein [Catenaria anguillulae PL171]|uniref:Exocyst complex component Sec6-domain-containing protein n=1 Tax=Catenaria anguillulae PL171 TaxID=765915 RepID=A0A1Y2I0W8_9FUNG|nr:exocyst complex component Sec6-domain-containing protein [Catenaria anguillulae PL171]